jgi:hypothetical protein
MLNRREFIATVTGLAIGAGAPTVWRGRGNPLAIDADSGLNYKIYATGRQGARYQGSTNLYNEQQSVVSEINLQTGTLRRVLLPMGEAHSVFVEQANDLIAVLPQYYIQAAFLDIDLKPRGFFHAPEGYVFSGHGLKPPGTDLMFCTLHPHKGAGSHIKPDGIIQVYDLSTCKLVDQFSSGGVLPHDMSIFRDGRRAAVAHAGNRKYITQPVAGSFTGYTSASSLFTPKLSIIDLYTRHVVQEMPVEQNEALVHLTVTQDDQVYGVLQRFIEWSKKPSSAVGATELDTLQKGGLPYSLHELELPGDNQGVAIPLPLIHFNPQTGTTRPIFTAPDKQRRSQSVIHHSMTGTVIAVYVYSEYLVCVPPAKPAFAVRSSDLGLQSPIGLCDLPGTPYFAVAGMMDDIAIVDARDMGLVHLVRTPLFRSSHLTVQAI